MKTIGLIGGMSWESSLEYYRIINKGIKERLGGNHSAKCILYSFDFKEVDLLQHQGNWKELKKQMIDVSMKLKMSGADFIVICTNTMHVMATDIEEHVGLKVLHIADCTANRIKEQQIKKVALLGTRFTMKGNFYKSRIKDKYDIDVIIPSDEDIEIIHRIIYDELVKGIFKESSRIVYQEIIIKLKNEGAEGVILGCTEIPLLIKQNDVDIPIFNTTKIHSEEAVYYGSLSSSVGR